MTGCPRAAAAILAIVTVVQLLPWAQGTGTLRLEAGQLAGGAMDGTVIMNGSVALVWNGSLDEGWTSMGGAQAPAPRYSGEMVYDALAGLFILFGGENGGYYNDTWSYDPDTNIWTERRPSNPPSARCDFQMAFDEKNEVLVLYGGYDGRSWLGDMWFYYPGSNTWASASPTGSPGVQGNGDMAYDPSSGLVLLFTGSVGLGTVQTWGFNYSANTWTNLNPANPPTNRAHHCVAYDPPSGLMVLFGGVRGYSGTYGETWTYNVSGNVWAMRRPPSSPPARYEHGMAYCSATGEVTVHGGFNVDSMSYWDDTWGYNTTTGNWTRKSSDVSPLERSDPAMAGGRADVLVFFGGYDRSTGAHDDTWAYGLRGSYAPWGTYTSVPLDAGGPAVFGNLSWDADLPSGASVALRLRTADTNGNLSNSPFSGPDGQFDSYYSRSGQKIYSHHGGSRWVQYRAYLSTTNPLATPTLRSVSVELDLPPWCNITSPAGGENWTGVHDITWTADDPDNDTLAFDLYLKGAAGETLLVGDLPDGARSWAWNSTFAEPGLYRVRLVAKESGGLRAGSEALSAEFWVPKPNRPPAAVPLSPPNNTKSSSGSVELRWNGSDPDGDPLSYKLFWADRPFDEATPLCVLTGELNHTLTGLADGATYYWSVVPSDGKTDGPPSVLMRFSVSLPPRNRPPVLLAAAALEATVGLELAYSLNASDQDGDRLAYDLVTGEEGMTVDPNTGRFAWRPKANQSGNFTAAVRVSDGNGGTADGTLSISVRAVPPVCTIFRPRDGQRLSGSVTLNGTARPGALPVSRVQVRFDDGQWVDAYGTQNWSCPLDTRQLPNGRHTLSVRAHDGELYSEPASALFEVDNRPAAGGFIPAIGTAALMAAMAIAALAAGAQRWKRELVSACRTP